MTKPRFVVDPVPDLAGLDPREQQQAFMAWAQRQFDRIHDWWPKDSEDRLIALEELNTKIKGFWPIVDYSIVQFEGTASAEQIYIARAFILGSVIGDSASLSKSLDGYDDFQYPYSVTGLGGAADIVDNGAGVYAVISNETIYYSQDAVTWIESKPWTVTGHIIGGLIWDGRNNRWLAAMHHPDNYPSDAGFYLRSTVDFSSWTTVYEDSTSTVAGCNSLCADGNGNLLSVGNNNSDPYLRYSIDDGVTWTTVDIASYSPASWFTINCEYQGGKWFILGSYALVFRSNSAIPNTGFSAIHAGGQFDSAYWITYGKTSSGGDCWIYGGNDATTPVERFKYSYNADGFSYPTTPVGATIQPMTGRGVVWHETYGWLYACGPNLWKSDDCDIWVEAPDDGIIFGSGLRAAAIINLPAGSE